MPDEAQPFPVDISSLGRAAHAGAGGSMREIGLTGLRHWGGFVLEEWLPDLQYGRQAAEVYREMSDNDPVIGGILYCVEHLVRKVSWTVQPASGEPADELCAEFVQSCLDDMSQTWGDTICEILTMLPYGYSYHELVYKRRGGFSRNPMRNSKYSDGRIGWRKIPIRAQDTLWHWEIDETGGIQAMIQMPPPDYVLRTVPIEKALLFRTRIWKNNPEGRSCLRNAYRPWYFLKNIQEIEAIGIERDLAGIPVLVPPEGLDIWNSKDPATTALRTGAEALVRQIRRDEQEGVVIPWGWELKLLSTGGRRQFDTGAVVQRYEQRIATTMLADMILLGQDKVGSYALSATKKDLFAASLAAYLDQIAAVFNRYAIPRLLALNTFPGVTGFPTLEHGKVQEIDLPTLGVYVQQLAQAGFPLFPNDELQKALLEHAELPSEAPEVQKADEGGAAAGERYTDRLAVRMEIQRLARQMQAQGIDPQTVVAEAVGAK